MATYESVTIMCPYYLHDNPKTCCITCEGIPPGSTIKSHFDNGAMMRRQISTYCGRDYGKCPWAILLSRGKYGESK